MNIFVLDYDLQKCAQYHNNRHICKMIIESAQMLSTVCRLTGLDEGYKTTHINHPCNKWCRKSLSNWLWLRDLVIELNKEYRYRYNKNINHKSYDITMSLSLPDIKDKGLTSFAQAMPDKYKNSDVVKAYRNYYIHEKSHIAQWKNREIPYWFK